MSNPSSLWSDLRRDDGISGHQPATGNIQYPEIAWRQRLGGPIFDAFTFTSGDETFLLLIYGGCLTCHDSTGKKRWKTDPHGIEAVIGIDDVDDDNRLEIIATNGRSFFVFDGSNGRTLCEEYLGPPFSGGFIYTNALLHRFKGYSKGMQLVIGLLSSKEVVLYDFASGADKPERCHLFWMDDFFHPSILAVDIDNDGEEEILVTKLSSVFGFDPVSGELKAETTWTSGGDRKRNYGLFEARDLNNNGLIDMLLLSYVVSRHVAVVENDGIGNLHNRWDRFIGHIYPHDESELRYCWNSCIDIDSDSHPEVVFSTWNETGKEGWQTTVLNAWDGKTKAILSQHYLRGVFPGNSRIPPLIFVSDETTRLPNSTGNLKLLCWKEDRFQTLWEGKDFAPLGRFPRRTPTKTIFRCEHPPDEDIWYTELDGNLTFFLINAHREVYFLSQTSASSSNKESSFQEQRFLNVSNVAALLAIEDLDHDGNIEFFFSDWYGNVQGVRADGTELFSIETGPRYRYGASLYFYAKPFAQPIVVEDNGKRFCVVPDGGEQIQILRWNRDESHPELHRSFTGRGRVGPEEGHHSPVAVEWENQTMLLVSHVGYGSAILKLISLTGEEQKRWELPHLPANPPLPRGRTGIHEYRLVETSDGPLLFISGFRTGSMNSETTFALHAHTHNLLWNRTNINNDTEAAFAPWNASTVWGGSENPQVVFLAKDTFCQIDLRTGKLLKPSWQLRPWNTADLQKRGMSMDDFAAYGTPAPVQFNQNEKGWVLLCNYGGIGAINTDHSVRWWKSFPLPSLTVGFGGLADIDNDGDIEIGLSLADGDFICLCANSGLEKWRVHLGSVAADVISCDIDGDGRAEFVMSTREGEVIAIGSARNGVGLIKWRLQLDYSLGPPIIADFDNDGLPEILVVGGDGYLYCITNRAKTLKDLQE